MYSRQCLCSRMCSQSVRCDGSIAALPAHVCADRCSSLAASQTSFAASALTMAIPSPTRRSGQPERQNNVTSPARMIAMFAKASLRADRNAARVRLPEWCRNLASTTAHARLTAKAPSPVPDSSQGSGGVGALNFCHAVQSSANAGTNRIAASTMPARALLRTDHPRAAKIKKLTAASSRKSMLSAKSETDPIFRATKNSTKNTQRLPERRRPRPDAVAAASLQMMRSAASHHACVDSPMGTASTPRAGPTDSRIVTLTGNSRNISHVVR